MAIFGIYVKFLGGKLFFGQKTPKTPGKDLSKLTQWRSRKRQRLNRGVLEKILLKDYRLCK